MRDERHKGFRDAHEDSEVARGVPETEQTRSPAYRLAFADEEFIYRDELRPVRLQLELLKTELLMGEAGIESTVVLFGGARIPPRARAEAGAAPGTMHALSHFYDEAQRFARMVTERSLSRGGADWVICTGGGPGVMEAGNRGAAEAGGRSVGLSIVLPHEQAPNRWVTPELCFNFHYFGIRKMHFLMRAAAIAVFPGGFGTLDETFEALTLIQTGRMEQVPFLLFGEAFWTRIIDFDGLVEAGTISPEDLDLFRYVETADEALAAMDAWENAGEKRAEIPGR
jgi:uncharacterized protein (TIGR00730 family)